MTGTTGIKKMTSPFAVPAVKLKGLWIPLKKALTFSPADDIISPQKNLSVSIEKGGLSIAYGSRFLSRVTIRGARKYAFEEGKYPQPEELISSLSLSLNEFNASCTDLTLGIPKAWTIVKTAEFPCTVRENIPDVISYEMDRLTPFIPEEAFFDFRVLKDDGERLTLLIMAAKADTIRPYISVLRENGFRVNRLTVNLSGLGTLCRYLDRKDDAVFVEMDDKGYEGALFLDGSITQAVAGDLSSCDEKTKTEKISTEIRALAEAAKGRGRSPQVFALLKDKAQTLNQSFKLRINMPVRMLGEMNLGLKSDPREGNTYAAVGAVLESLWTKAGGLNLLTRGRHDKKEAPVALTVTLILAIIFMWALYIIAPLRVEEKRLEEINRQLVLKKQEAEKVEALKKDLEAIGSELASIKNFKDGRPMALSIFKELSHILPKTAWLTRIRLTDTSVDIEGYAGSATELLPKLEASKYFRRVEFASPTYREAKMNSDRFVIKMEIEGAVKNEGIKSGNEKK